MPVTATLTKIAMVPMAARLRSVPSIPFSTGVVAAAWACSARVLLVYNANAPALVLAAVPAAAVEPAMPIMAAVNAARKPIIPLIALSSNKTCAISLTISTSAVATGCGTALIASAKPLTTPVKSPMDFMTAGPNALPSASLKFLNAVSRALS